MIKILRSNNQHITVSGSPPYFYSNGGPEAGRVHYNTQTQCLQIFDGSVWHNMSYEANIDLSGAASVAIDWAQRKMHEEQRLKAAAETNPTLKDALDALHRAEEQVRIVAALVDNA